MTEFQYRMCCSIFGRVLSREDLSKMNMSQVDGVFDDDIEYNIYLYLKDIRNQKNKD